MDKKETVKATDAAEKLKVLCLQKSLAFEKKFAAYSKDRYFEVEANVHMGILFTTVLLRSSDESFYYPISTKIDIEQTGLDLNIAFELQVEFVSAYLEDYFQENEEVYLPIEWAPFELNGYQLAAKGQILNRKLERLADEWLDQHNHQSS